MGLIPYISSMNDRVVYFHRRNDTNEVFYVGIGKKRRPYQTTKRSRFWNFIVDRVEYTIEIIHEGLTWDEACEYEKKYIKDFGRRDNGTGILCNMTDGGEGALGTACSEENKKLLSEQRIGIPKTKKQVRKGVKTRMRNGSYFHTQESKTNISNGLRNTFDDPNYIHPTTGKKHTEYAKNEMSKKRKGVLNPASTITKEVAIMIKKECMNITKNYGFNKRISEKYNTSLDVVRNIKIGKTWKHLTI